MMMVLENMPDIIPLVYQELPEQVQLYWNCLLDRLYGAALLETFNMSRQLLQKKHFSQMLFELTSHVQNLNKPGGNIEDDDGT